MLNMITSTHVLRTTKARVGRIALGVPTPHIHSCLAQLRYMCFFFAHLVHFATGEWYVGVRLDLIDDCDFQLVSTASRLGTLGSCNLSCNKGYSIFPCLAVANRHCLQLGYIGTSNCCERLMCWVCGAWCMVPGAWYGIR